MIHYITPQGLHDAWVGNELRIVQEAKVPFVLHAMREPGRKFFKSDWAKKLSEETKYLYPLPFVGTIVSLLLAPFLFGGRFFSALFNAIFGKRESMRARIATFFHFIAAVHWARGLRSGEPVTHIHSQWIHSGGSIGMYGAWLLGKSFSFTGHAADLFRNRAALDDKIKRADFIICISSFHRQFYLDNGARPEQLHIAYCGIDTSLFSPARRERQPDEPYTIISAGRLVEKKGFEYLIDACKILSDRGVDYACKIEGSGPLDEALRARVKSLGIDDRVKLTGKVIAQEDIPGFMNSGDVYCLPCVWAADNDVDGLPQMIMEGMACGVPAISTRLVGIPDLIEDGVSGLLCDPNNAEQLADKIVELMNDDELATKLSEGARKMITEKFDISVCLEPLLNQYRAKLNMD